MPADQIIVTQAVWEEVIPRIGLLGPAGSGKTLTSLRLATGIRQTQMEIEEEEPGPIVLIDMENRRSLFYAPPPGQDPEPPKSFDFQHVDLIPPFNPARIKAVAQKVLTLGPSVVIIDSFSHEWAGAGGILEMVDTAQATSRNKFGAWKKPKQAHRELMSVMEQAQVPFILNFRAKEKLSQVGSEIVNLGWKAISEPEAPYDMTLNFLLGRKNKGALNFLEEFEEGKVYIDMLEAGIIKDGELGTEDVGRRLALWAAGRLDLLEAK